MNQQEAGRLDEQKIWQAHGWISAQQFAIQHLGHEWQPTSGSKGEVDQIWMSPETASLCRKFSTQDVFSGHMTLVVHLQIPVHTVHQWTWPLPTEIPWQNFEQQVGESTSPLPPCTGDPTTVLKAWAQHFETHVQVQADQQKVTLPAAWRGRATRTAPCKHMVHTPLAKPSREGEITLTNDAIGLSQCACGTSKREGCKASNTPSLLTNRPHQPSCTEQNCGLPSAMHKDSHQIFSPGQVIENLNTTHHQQTGQAQSLIQGKLHRSLRNSMHTSANSSIGITPKDYNCSKPSMRKASSNSIQTSDHREKNPSTSSGMTFNTQC